MQSVITHLSLALILAPSFVFAEERIVVGVGLSDAGWSPFVFFTTDEIVELLPGAEKIDVSSEDGEQETGNGALAADGDACHLIEDGVIITRTSRGAATACVGFTPHSEVVGVRTRRR